MAEADPSLPVSDSGTDADQEREGVREVEQGDGIRQHFEPLFAGTGGIDSWLGSSTPPQVFDRLNNIDQSPLSRSQLAQLMILSHEAGPSEGFFNYYWLRVPQHTYDVTRHGLGEEGFDSTWVENVVIVSLAHLRWGLYRFYVDALLYFGNIRSAYRSLRDKTESEIAAFFDTRRVDTDALRLRGPALPLTPIAKDDRYLVAEYACKSLDAANGSSELETAAVDAYRAHIDAGGDALITVDALLRGSFVEAGRQQQFMFSADDILQTTIGSELELKSQLQPLAEKFSRARGAALHNTKLYLSMADGLDVYVATSMRTRDHFRKMATFCEDVFGNDDLRDLHLRYFDPTMSAADGHVDKGLIECLMVDAAKILVYYAGDRESLGKDFEAAMALSRGKPVIVYCEDEEKLHLYREVHPLMRLIEFDTGVAVGSMVTNSTTTVSSLLRSLLTNQMSYEVVKTSLGALHLMECQTRSLVRIQTHDRLLQETFWNYFHRRGALD